MTLRDALPTLLKAAGQQAPVQRRCLYLGCLTAVLRGLAFLSFIPLFFALNAGDGHRAVLCAGLLSVLALLSSVSDWQARAFDYEGYSGRASDELRRALGAKLRRLPLEKLYQKRSGDFAATIAGDVDDVINYTMTIALMFLQAVLTPLVVGLGALFFDWRLGLAMLLIFPAIVPIYLAARPQLQRNQQDLAQAFSTLTAETVEYTQGLAILKTAGCVDAQEGAFAQAAARMEHLQKQALEDEALPSVLLGSMVEIGLWLIVALGLWLLSGPALALLFGLMVASVRFAEPLSIFISMMNTVEMMLCGYERLQTLQAIAPLPQLPAVPLPQDFSVRFAEVEFCYQGTETPALKAIDLTLPARALTAVVGGSGGGKTTLARLLLRYADPQRGRVEIGGVDLRALAPEDLSRLVAVVFQEVYLFDDTILANIRMGRPEASEAEIIAAAQAAQAHDFILALPQGYHTRVGDIGNALSGGEKQRISIARALLKDAPIVILDEPTAALDTFSELAVQRAINVLVKNKTVLVIAHRLSTIVAAEQIVVLDAGQIVERGRHAELLAQNGRYAALWALQAGQS